MSTASPAATSAPTRPNPVAAEAATPAPGASGPAAPAPAAPDEPAASDEPATPDEPPTPDEPAEPDEPVGPALGEPVGSPVGLLIATSCSTRPGPARPAHPVAWPASPTQPRGGLWLCLDTPAAHCRGGRTSPPLPPRH